MDPGQQGVGNQPPVVNNTPPAAPAKTPEQLQAEQDAANAAKNAPKQTPEQQAAAAEAARVAAMDIDFIQGTPEQVGTINAAIKLMKDAGVKRGDASAIFGKAFETGNIADVNKAELAKKVGAEKAALIMAAVVEYNSRVGSTRVATVKAVHETMGGQENWNKVRSWARAREAVDPAFANELNEYRSMIDIGGKSAQYAAQELRKLYEADPKNSSLSRAVVAGDGTVLRVENPITNRQEYVKLLKQAHAKNDIAAVRQIEARRAAGRAIAAQGR